MEQLQYTAGLSRRKRRAQRFPLRIGLRFRHSTDSQWHEGTTENISSSGVLFRTDHGTALNAPVELKLILPPGNSRDGSPEVLCRGIVARIAASDSARSLLLGTRFLNYRLMRR